MFLRYESSYFYFLHSFKSTFSSRIDVYTGNLQKKKNKKKYPACNPFRTRKEEKTKKLDTLKEKPPLVYTVPDFNITDIVIIVCLRKVVLAAGARCVMSFTYGFLNPTVKMLNYSHMQQK